MRKIIATTAFTLLLCFQIPVANATTACGPTSTEASHDSANGTAANGEDGYCFYTPEQMNVKIYEFGLCTSASSPTNKSSCEQMFQNTAGVDFNLSVGSVSDLLGEVTVTEGVAYTHAYIVLSNTTSISTTIEFSTERRDDKGNLGKYCFTDGRSVNDVPEPPSIMQCSNDPNDPKKRAAPETIVFGDPTVPAYDNKVLNYTVSMGGTNIVSDLYMVDDTFQMSTSFADDHAIYGSQQLATPITIDMSATSFDIGFSITDGVTVGFDDIDTPALTGPMDVVFEGLRFNIAVN